MDRISIFWHRRDLRLADNAGAYEALNGSQPVVPLFIFDRNILDKLEDKDDARVTFLHDTLSGLKKQLRELGSDILVRYGDPIEVWKELLNTYNVSAVYTNRDYEPYAKKRDTEVEELLRDHGVVFQTYKDQIIFEKEEVLKKDGGVYTVFTPMSKRWKKQLATRSASMLNEAGEEVPVSYFFKPYPNQEYFSNYHKFEAAAIPALETMGFTRSTLEIPNKTVSQGLIRTYDETRNFPAIEGTSRLGIHFRFGTISIREKARKAQQLNDTFLNELIWRDFYSNILDAFPHVAERSFRPKYDFIEWRNNEGDFERWCAGETGYPIVDAGMRELNATGYMHNRVRMITASFLTKHLLIDWRWGEAYFARKLLDFDLASNNGGWQWAAGSGTDAAPYFRIFNPYSQQEKFDKEFKYIGKWVPEFQRATYPKPIIEHKIARERCLERYKAGLDRAESAGS